MSDKPRKSDNQKVAWGLTLEELWQLFPIQLEEHNPAWLESYEQESQRLQVLLAHRIVRIDHIGSTAVKGLLAKPIVDILLQLSPNTNLEEVKVVLKSNGWILMAENSEFGELDFSKGYTSAGFAREVFHLHIRPVGDWDELVFRDYLRNHSEVAAEYAVLKKNLREQFEHNRDAYTAAKSDFIKTHTAAARKLK